MGGMVGISFSGLQVVLGSDSDKRGFCDFLCDVL